MDKIKVLADIESLYDEINKCTNDLVVEKLNDDKAALEKLYTQMESLMAKTQQQLDFLFGYIDNGYHVEKEQKIVRVKYITYLDSTVYDLRDDGWEIKQMVRMDENTPLLLLCERCR